MTPAAGVPASPPLDPTVDEARSWLARELAQPAYADRRGLLDRLWEWMLEHLFGRSVGLGAAPEWSLPLVLGGLAVLVAVVLLVRVRRSPVRSRGRAEVGVLDEPHLDAAAYRRRAAEALDAGDHAAAAADAFRALAAAAAERTLLDDVPARTAHEIGAALAPVFPGAADEVRAAADLFDRAVYGRATVGEHEARGVVALEARLLTTRPLLARASGDNGSHAPGTPVAAGAAR